MRGGEGGSVSGIDCASEADAVDQRSSSQGIISALQELEQFKPATRKGDEAFNVMTGARLTALPDDEGVGPGLLWATFSGGNPMELIGELYLQLQVIESIRYERDGVQSSGDVYRGGFRIRSCICVESTDWMDEVPHCKWRTTANTTSQAPIKPATIAKTASHKPSRRSRAPSGLRPAGRSLGDVDCQWSLKSGSGRWLRISGIVGQSRAGGEWAYSLL